jgi:alkylation response protein AidB-like acyl-CoA dehydrogenase
MLRTLRQASVAAQDFPAGIEQNGQPGMIYTIFEGTSEIQKLVIARAVTGIHIP